MASPQKENRVSKVLSLVLRHQPEYLGIQLDSGGWASVAQLITYMNEKGHEVDFSLLCDVVTNNDKQRFTFNDDKSRIRANQGHSVNVDLEMHSIEPPSMLYHGTARRNLPSIMQEGLLKNKRMHVHLSDNRQTAISVGQRHGQPIVLQVDAGKMYEGNCQFYRSKNGIWLTDYVSPTYITVVDD